VLVGNGNPAQADYFRTRVLQLPAERGPDEPAIWTDPTLAAFNAAGMKRGRLRTFSPAAAGPLARALKNGFRQRRTMGDPWQQGGVLVVDQRGEVLFAHNNDNPGDHPTVEDVLAALARA